MDGRAGPSRRLPLNPVPDSWYRVASVDDVPVGTVFPVRAFGRDLICYRGGSGRLSVLDAYCPHLGANIGCGGFVDGDEVVCPFHHWRFDADGRNTRIPYRDRPNRGARLGSWRTLERNGQILVWYSSRGAEPDWEPPELAEATSPDFVRIESEAWLIKTHVQEIFENTVDIAHFQYVHGVSGFGAVEVVENGPMFRAVASVTMQTSRGPVDGAVESELWGMGLDLVRQRGIGQAVAAFTITPIDIDLVRASYTFFVPRDPETGGPSKYGHGFMREFSRQITQDIPIWEAKVHHKQPRLAAGEGAIMDFRRWAEQFNATPSEVAI
jgi:Phenylpropionate dioxygenase and related ring-hydroxylating dioxygenases, large terminal subunit